tara:strand:+ start:1585 stop:1761 length:177 start_codon:yes stop_codon:yes gene_type:complete
LVGDKTNESGISRRKRAVTIPDLVEGLKFSAAFSLGNSLGDAESEGDKHLAATVGSLS